MQTLKRIAESYLGVPGGASGQGTAWTWQHALPALSIWVYILLFATACAFVLFVYRRDAHFASRPIRALLVALRLMVLVIAMAFISGLALSVDQTDFPLVVVLIDDSASMSFDDHYQDPKLRQLTADVVASSADSAATRQNATRLDIVKSLLAASNTSLLEQLAANYRLKVYRFSETAILLGDDDTTASENALDNLVARIQAIEPEGEQTRPAPAARHVLDDLRGQTPSAVVVFTDGIATVHESEQLSAVIPAFRQRGVPVFAVGVGSEQLARDIQVYDVSADEVAFVDDPIVFTGKVKASGELAGNAVNVVLRHKDSARELARTTIETPTNGEAVSFDVSYTSTEAGDFDFVVGVDPLPNETDGQNNVENRQVSVRGEKIRVLMVESTPRYEFRHLKYLLERETTVELKTVLYEADLEFATEDKTALESFPLQADELTTFDVVIFGDVDPGQLSSNALTQLVDFVRDGGGSLLTIVGEQYFPHEYVDTPLAEILPVQLEKFNPQTDELLTLFHPKLTIDGQKGVPVFRLSSSESEDARLWKSFPPLRWMHLFAELRTGARVFMDYTLPETPPRTFPVIVMHQYGAGRVLLHATDELWRWKFRENEEYYQKYWIQMLRYLSRTKRLGQSRSIELDVDRRKYRQGEAVLFRARFMQQNAGTTNRQQVTVMIERQGGEQQQIELRPVPNIPFVYEGTIEGLREGSYRGWVVEPSFGDKPPSTEFLVESTQQELHDYRLREADLKKTAVETRGAYYTPAEIGHLTSDLPPGEPVLLASRTRIPLWNRVELLVLFICLLAAEWFLRKRFLLI